MVKYTYDAWGNHTISGTEATTIGVLNPIRYRGYFFDTETGFYFLQTRYYDPEVGRFLNMDAYAYADPETVNGLNLYAYCANNPVMYTDETGCSILLTLLFGFLIGFAISGAVEIGNQVDIYGWDASIWNWEQIGLSALGGGVAGLFSAIPFGGAVGAFFFGGVGSVLGGIISGSVTDTQSFFKAFAIGSVANLIGYGVAKGIENFRVNKIMSLSPKAKSATIWKLKGTDPSTLTKAVRYSLKNLSKKEVAEVVKAASVWLKNGIQASLVSSALSAFGG